MATITITIEDSPDGKVRIKSDPSFEIMASMDLSGHDLTPAHGYAFAMLNKAREVSKSADPTNLIHIPRIGR